MKRTRFATLIAALAMTACHDQVGPEGGLLLELDPVPAVVAIGAEDTLGARLRNLTSEPVTLTFSSACTIQIVVAHAGSDTPVPGVEYVCAAVVSPVTIPAHAEIRTQLIVHGGAPAIGIHPGFPLASGHYSVWAELAHNQDALALRTPAAEVEVP